MDVYAATLQLPHGSGFKGQLRDVYAGEVTECAHKHKNRSTALACATKMLAQRTAQVAA